MAVALRSLPTPRPPATTNAPLLVATELALLVMLIALLVVDPRLVILCSVLVFHIVIAPVLVLMAVSVPAKITVWLAYRLMLAVVTTCAPEM